MGTKKRNESKRNGNVPEPSKILGTKNMFPLSLPRGPGLFKVDGSYASNADPKKQIQAKARKTQLDPTWNPHQKLKFLKLCVRTTPSQIGQIL